MSLSSDQIVYTSYFTMPQRAHTDPSFSPRSPLLGVPQKPSSRIDSPTQYEFIMSTGDESATAARQKLKTVRSHVMKNYLQQQQQQRHGRGSKNMSLSGSTADRRKSKQRARSNRSASQEFDSSQSAHGMDTPVGLGIGSLFAGVSLVESFADHRTNHCITFGNQQPFALDFSYNAPQDEVSHAAQNYINSLIRDRGVFFEPSFDTINAQVEVVRMVKESLGVCGNDAPQSIIFAVALLAFGCAVEREWDQARGHLEALQRIIESRGDGETIDFELQRTFTWTAYCIDGALCLPPQFPPPLFPNVKTFPLAFLDEAQIRAWRTIKRFPKDSSFVFDVVVRLHHLGLATSSEWYSNIDQRALSNLYFEAMYHVLAFQHEEIWMKSLPSGIQGQEAAMMFRIWGTGLPLFVWGTVRHVRSRLGLMITRSDHEPVLAKIKDTLEAAGGHHSWPRGKRLEPVLATLVYGIESCDLSSPWRSWAIETLRKVIEMLKLKCLQDFHKALDFFPSTEEYKIVAADIWGETTGSLRQPTVSISPV